MKISAAQERAYLKCIDVQGPLDNSEESLKKIVEGHAFTFPFEVINIHNSQLDDKTEQRFQLGINALFKKLVVQHRGGHCVELNILLQTMLKHFGFKVLPIAPENLWEERDVPKGQRSGHTAAIVTLQGKEYLIDAAFGGLGIMSPLLLQEGIYQQFSERFRLLKSADYSYELQVIKKHSWVSLYGFEKKRATQKRYQAVAKTNSNPLNPKSYFKELFLCTLPCKVNAHTNGRYRVCNNEFKNTSAGKLIHHEKIISQQQLHDILFKHFKIDLKKCFIRHRELDMKAYQLGISRPPVLHSYATRLKEKYLGLAAQMQEVVTEYNTAIPKMG